MLRLGVIGMGSRVSGLLRKCLLPQAPDARVVGVVDPDEPGARSRLPEADREDAAFYKSVDALMRKARPEGVLIGTRCNLHAPYAAQAAKYDVPLFLEKPVAVALRQATDLERAFAGSKCPVVVSFPLRVTPLCVLAKEYLDRGAVGRPEHILADNYVSYGTVYFVTAYRNFEVTRGLFMQKATHDFDYMQFLMDSPIVRIAARANWGRVFGGDKPADLTCAQCGEARTCPESPRNLARAGLVKDPGKDRNCPFSRACGSPEAGMNEDCSSALVEFASGAHGMYTQVFFTRRDAGRRGPTISGYRGTLSFDWRARRLRHVRHHEPVTETVEVNPTEAHSGGDPELVRDFLDLIRGEGRSRTPIQTGLASIYACLAAQKSSHTDRFERVRQVGL